MGEKRKRLNLNDFMNKKYGCLTIIGIAELNTSDVRNSKVRVRCDCGKESDKLLSNVLKSQSACSKLCDLYGVERTKKTIENKYINKKYGHLTIRSYVGRVAISPSHGNGRTFNRPIVRCECDCGRMIDLRLYFITHEDVTTCGKCNLSSVRHGITAGNDPVMFALNSRHNYIAKHARTSSEFQVSKEWFNDDDPIPAIHNFINYCKPLYEKAMNDGNHKRIFIHRIDINKPLGPGNIYFDHHMLNIHYPGKVFY
jgi:hypothetical protein